MFYENDREANKQYILNKIRVLAIYADRRDREKLRNMENHLITDYNGHISPSLADELSHIEDMVLDHLTPSEKKALLKDISGSSAKLNVNASELKKHVEFLEKNVNRLMDRPQLHEREAQKKLDEINAKFTSLMNLKEKNFNITDKISDVEKLTKDLEKLEADAQNLINDVSTVKLGMHYQEAKNRYKFSTFGLKNNKYIFSSFKLFAKKKKNNKLYWALVLIMPIDFLISILLCSLEIILKNLIQKDVFFYVMFLSSLFGFGLLYWHFSSGENLDYKYLPLAVPFIWSAWFFQRKINTKENLFEIYNHKQRVMETYVAFKASSYNFGSEIKMEEALLEAVKKDPSDCIGNNNNTIIESVLDRVKGVFISGKATKALQDGFIITKDDNNR